MTLSEQFKRSKRQAMLSKLTDSSESKPSVAIMVITKEPEPSESVSDIELEKPLDSMKVEDGKMEEECCEYVNSIDSFCSTLKSFEVLAKLLHWKSFSHSQHLALDELVSGLSSHVDILVESAQFERQLDITVLETKVEMDALESVREMLEFVRVNRCCLPYSFQQSTVDLIEELLSQIIFKLNFLK